MKRPVQIAGLCLSFLVALSPVASFAAAANASRECPYDGEVVGYDDDGGMFILVPGPYGSPILIYWNPGDTDPFEEESGFVDR